MLITMAEPGEEKRDPIFQHKSRFLLSLFLSSFMWTVFLEGHSGNTQWTSFAICLEAKPKKPVTIREKMKKPLQVL
jgi:hypothetical protein